MRKNLRRFGRVVVIGAAILWSAGAQAAERVALVIGNGDYGTKASFLVNPRKDAVDVAEALKRIGFDEVVVLTDQSVNQMTDALRAFKILADSAEIAVIYYAGHGLEAGGVNYLVPVGAGLTDIRDAPLNLVTLDLLRSSVSGAGSLSLIILDACRDNPFPQLASSTRSLSPTRGLGRASAAPSSRNEVVAYAAADGQRAQDGPANGNSPYAKELIEALEATPRLPLSSLLGRVRDRVWNSTDGLQTPHQYGSTGEREVYLQALLLPPPGQSQQGPISPPAPPPVWTPPQVSPGTSTSGSPVADLGGYVIPDVVSMSPGGFALAADGQFFRDSSSDPVQSRYAGAGAGTQTTQPALVRTPPSTEQATPTPRYALYAGENIPRLLPTLGSATVRYSSIRMWGETAEVAQRYQQEARWGNANSMANLGVMYFYGRSVRQNDFEAARLFRRAMEKESAIAMNNLGAMYELGRGVPLDLREAQRLYEQAASSQNAQEREWARQALSRLQSDER